MMNMVAIDKPIFDAFRDLTGDLMPVEVAAIKACIRDIDEGREDHSLFKLFATMDDDDRISPHEFQTIKAAVDAYQVAKKGGFTDPLGPVPFKLPVNRQANDHLTLPVMLEILSHESIVLEAYRDSKKIWTWGGGVTNASGHSIDRYVDNPQTIEKVLQVYIWLLQRKYAPDVMKAFSGRNLTDHQFAAALSFHYNTGAILRASWVKSWLAGNVSLAYDQFMNYRRPPEIIGRRKQERDLFFDGKWSNDGKTTIYGVRKPSYYPDWSSARRVDISKELAAVIA